MKFRNQQGQSLIELVVGIGVGILFITAAIGILTVAIRLDFQNKFSQAAGELAQEALEQIDTFANADWHNLDLASRDTPYHLATSSTFFTLQSGSSTAELDGTVYTTSFKISDVCRDGTDTFVDCTGGAVVDPSTLKITTTTAWQQQGENAPEIELTHYVTRIRNRLWLQSDWSAGSSSIAKPDRFTTSTMSAGWFEDATNTNWLAANAVSIFDTNQNLHTVGSSGASIDPLERYAWNDIVGWFDFWITHRVTVSSTLTGYALSWNGAVSMTEIGELAFDCATSPNGDICAPSNGNFSVIQDANGIFSGYAWNDAIGWISFNCSDTTSCATSTPCPTSNQSNCVAPSGGQDYYVWLDAGTGYFHGWAWNDEVGWLSFNCSDTSSCGTSSFAVKTSGASLSWAELDSLPFDTERVQGAGFNTIMWHGTLPAGTNVKFQIATADAVVGPWNFIGPDGSTTDYYQPISYNIPVRINRSNHNNDRFVRYRLILESDPTQEQTPIVNDVIINWSN